MTVDSVPSAGGVEPIWELLPAALRTRDAEAGGLLHALLTIIAAQADVLAEDIDALADDAFIETCSEWVVPYLGDLLGVTTVHPLGGTAAISNRARVANTIRFRRRKGTAAMLEELARATTGWTARAVELFQLLSTTQHLNHVRLGAPAMAHVRSAETMELVDTPFDTVARTVDVRPLGGARARPNIPNVALYLWPLTSYPLERATAVAVSSPPDGRWLVDPLGVDHHLAAPTVAEPGIDHRADEPNTPGPLRRRPLHAELDAQREAPVDPARLRWFQPDDPSFVVWIQETAAGPLAQVALDDLHVCDQSDWDLPTGSAVRVDPVLGRVAVAATRPVHRLAVSWSMAFGVDVGALPTTRIGDLGAAGETPDWQIGVSATDAATPGRVVPTLGDAVAAWHDWQAGNPASTGRIVVMDSHRYAQPLVAGGGIRIGQGARLSIVAASWPSVAGTRRVDAIDPARVRPTLVGDVEVQGIGSGDRPGSFVLDGIQLAGGVRVVAPAADEQGLGRVEIAHATLVPALGGIAIAAGNTRCELSLRRCIAGPVVWSGTGELDITDSVVHHPSGGLAIDAGDAAVTLAGVSVLGITRARTLTADDTVFTGAVAVARRQQGCVRFSYVPPGSATPRRYRCQPELAQAVAAGIGGSGEDPASVAARLVPAHESEDLASPGYARLAGSAAVELRTGSESGAEMGAYRTAAMPQRLANLSQALGEYLPFGRVAAPLLVGHEPVDLP
jgi:hypothetical protein